MSKRPPVRCAQYSGVAKASQSRADLCLEGKRSSQFRQPATATWQVEVRTRPPLHFTLRCCSPIKMSPFAPNRNVPCWIRFVVGPFALQAEVPRETLRRWMLAAGLWSRRRKRQPHDGDADGHPSRVREATSRSYGPALLTAPTRQVDENSTLERLTHQEPAKMRLKSDRRVRGGEPLSRRGVPGRAQRALRL